MENLKRSPEDDPKKEDIEGKEDYLKLRALERYKEGKESYGKQMEELLGRWEKIVGEPEEGPVSSEDSKDLEKSIAELAESMGEEKKEELEKKGRKNLMSYMRKRRVSLKKREELDEFYTEWVRAGFQKKNIAETTDFWRDTKKIKSVLEKKEQEIKDASRKSPEAFLADGLLTLREYKRQLKESGIVETPYIKERQDKIEETMLNEGVVALVGETGTGKTRIAEKIGKKLTGKSPEWVFGHANVTKEDLLYHLGIKPEKQEALDVPEQIEEAKKKYQELHPDIPENQSEKALALVEEVIKGQASEKEMQTEVIMGPVLKSAQEGKVVIIDEFNYIKPQLLASLNALVEAKPGKSVNFMGKEIKVQEGFGIIFTGNINVAGAKKYLEREKLDPAFVNRLNSGLIEYNTPPQEIKTNFTETLPTEGESKEGIDNDLFRIGVTHLVDEKGNLKAPEDVLDTTWRLSRCFSLLQKVYAGKSITEGEESYFDSTRMGTSFELNKYHASMRTFGAILESWKKDGFESDIDYHIYNNLIRPASAISPEEAAQMLYILRSDYGNFFSEDHSIWEKLETDSTPAWQIKGEDSLKDLKKEDIKEESPDHYFIPQELVESVTNKAMPKEAEATKEYQGAEGRREKVEQIMEEEQRIEEIESQIEGIKGTVEAFCKDESKIMGEET